MSSVSQCKASFGTSRRFSAVASGIVLAMLAMGGGTLVAQQGTSVSDGSGPKVIVPSTRTTQVMVLNGDASLTGLSTTSGSSYALTCPPPGGLAMSGGMSQTLSLDETSNAAFQTGAGSSTPLAVGRGVPYSGTTCPTSPAVAAGTAGAAAVLSAADIFHKRLYVVSASGAGADTITSYDTNNVGYYQQAAQTLATPVQASLDTGGTYTSISVDTDGLYGLVAVTELRTATNPGGTWIYNSFGKATRLLGPGGVDLPAINSFIIHNPTDGGGGLLVLVNQDGLTAGNLNNPPLDTTPFTIIDLGQVNELLGAKNYPGTLLLPTVTTVPSTLSYYAMLGAVYNPGDRKIYAVVGGGTSTTSIQRQVVRYDLTVPGAPTETVVNDVSTIPLTSTQATQLAINGPSLALHILAKDSSRMFSAGITSPTVAEITGNTFNDPNFVPTFIVSNPLLGETYVASTGRVDIVTRPASSKKQAVLDLTGSEVQATVGQGSVQLLGLFPDTSDPALSSTVITITATPVVGGAPFTFATINVGQTLTLPTYVSGTFPSANIYNLVANFPGDAQYAAVSSAPVTIAVGQALFNTTTTATASFNNTTGAGSASVTLSGSSYVPGGTITVKSVNTGSTLATFYLSGGLSNPMIIPFTAPPSTTAIVVAYSGDSKNQASTSGNVTLTASTSVTPTLTATVPSGGVVGSITHLNVVFASTTTRVPTGNVTIFGSSATSSYVAIGTVSAASAFATGGVGLNWTPIVPDSYSVYATYAGDSNYTQLTTQVGSIAITGGKYAFTLGSPTTVVAGSTFNVGVFASSGANATGLVTVNAFKLGTTTPVLLGTVNAAAAAATGGTVLSATIPSSGVYILNGSYAGDANYPASTSANSPTVNVTGGTTPAVTLTPAAVNLSAAVGASVQRNFLLFNTGGAGLTISSITTSGPGFSQYNGCPTVLQSGENCTINVTFAPTASGTVTGTLSVADNATGSPHTSALTGSNPIYAFTLGAPTTAAAGSTFNVLVAASSGSTATGVVTVTASLPATTTQITLGTVSASAAAANGGAVLAATIPNPGIYSITATYPGDSNYPAARSANTPTVNVTGGSAASVTITPSSANFATPVGSTVQRSFLLYNSGGAGLTISSITTTGQAFSQFNGCPTVLQSGTNCTVDVIFAPVAPGVVTGTLSIADNASGSPHTAALTGTGTPGSASISPGNLSFIDQTVGTGSFLRPIVTLTNTGSAAFNITSLTLSSTPDFEITTSPCASQGSLAPGGSCTVSLEFHPTSVGAKTATLTVLTSNSTVAQTVTITGNGLSGNPAVLPNCVDSDGDGLCDDWETNGVWVRTSATSEKFVDLPSMGADPKHKDIFIQADFMSTTALPAGDHTHKLKLSALAQLISAFNVSPVTNPDLTNGIHLHIDCGYDCTMDPVKKTLWGNTSLAQSLTEITTLDTVNTAASTNFDWSSFDAQSTAFSASGRKLIFHHLIMAHDLRTGDSTSGISRNGATVAAFRTGASDFIVSLGSWANNTGTALDQAGTLMHELGHNLSLQHGGRDEDNYKPNYFSVMNYNMQTSGLIIDGKNGYIDYSRFTLPTLNEAALNEQVAINVTAAGYPGSYGSPSADRFGTYYYCRTDDTTKVSPHVVSSVLGSVNWNCNMQRTVVGTTVTLTPYIDKTLVSDDINGDKVTSQLKSITDWPLLVFTGGSVAGNGAGTTPPTITPAQEITQEQASLANRIFGVALSGMGRVRTAPGSQMTLRFLLKNIGQTDDTYTVTTKMQNSWIVNTPAAATVSIAAGGQMELNVTYTVPASAAAGSFDKLFVAAVSQAAPQIMDSVQVETYATATPSADSISASAVNFGSQIVATTGSVQGVVILNTGSSSLSFGTVTTTTEFAQTNNCGASLAVGASCMVSINFTPAATGPRTGTLTINDGTGTAKTITLNGVGVPLGLLIPVVSLTATPAAGVTGQPVVLSVNVATLTSTPTGTATITDGTNQYGQVTLDASGNGTLTTSTLGSGSYSLYATYSGDTTYGSSNSAYTALSLVTATPTTAALTSSGLLVAPGASVTFTATIGGGSGTSQPTGVVRFLDGAVLLGTGTLNASGVATYTTTTLAPGTHAVTASYAGDTVFGASTSSAITETVGPFPTMNVLTSSATTLLAGASLTLTSTLTATAGGGTPTGTVTFREGAITLGTGTVNATAIATFATTALAIGTHSITAQYVPTGNFGASTSAAVQIVVTGAPDFSLSVNPGALTVTGGSTATAIFTMTPLNGYAGTAIFTCGTLPTNATCSFAPTKLTFTAATQTPQTTTFTFGTIQSAGLSQPLFPGRGIAPISLALGLPFGLLLGFGYRSRRRQFRHLGLVLALTAMAVVAGLSGCSSKNNFANTPAGTYTIPVLVTDGTTSHSISYSVTVK
jgi:hypothetical protein